MEEIVDYDDSSQKFWGNWTEEYLNDLDTSQYDFPNTLWLVRPANEIIVKSVFMVTVGIIGLYLNFVILYVLIKNRWLWSASNYLIGNMAWIDFLTLLICPWLMLSRDFYQSYPLGNFGCRFEGFLQASFLLANVGAVLLVSYDRLAAAALTSDARITRTAAPKLILVTWLVSIALSTPFIVKTTYMERQWKNYLEKYCIEDPMVRGIYWHVVHILLVWVPLGLMTLTYGSILWRLEFTARDLKTRGGGQVVARAKHKAIRVTACVLLADIICRVPFSTLIYWRNFNSMQINSVEGGFDAIWFASQFLMYFNCAVNPLIYGFTNARFRKAMDKTPGVACCKFGTWCCACAPFKKKQIQIDNQNNAKIFIIENSPKQNRKLSRMIKNILHINKDTVELSIQKVDENTTKPTKVTPMKGDNVYM